MSLHNGACGLCNTSWWFCVFNTFFFRSETSANASAMCAYTFKIKLAEVTVWSGLEKIKLNDIPDVS